MRALIEKPLKSRWGWIMVFAAFFIMMGRWSNGQPKGLISSISAVLGVIGVFLFAFALIFFIIAIENDTKKTPQ
jgi:hypothetical protein